MIGLIMFFNLIAVDIKGEVQNPGVYFVEQANIRDIIHLAGGTTHDADTRFINLARNVVDEMVIYIPNLINREKRDADCDCPPLICLPHPILPFPETPPTTVPITTTVIPTTTTQVRKIININTAPVSELILLRGVGEVIAERIIVFREATPFVTIEDLLKVSGIGEVIFAQIKDYITV